MDLLKYIKKRNKNTDIFFIMGADSLINFHKWKNSDLISSILRFLYLIETDIEEIVKIY